MRSYFAKFGDVKDAVIMFDPVTKRSRGFGFVIFADADVMEYVITQRHVLDDKQLEIRRAVPKGVRGAAQSAPRSDKIFVGALPYDISEEDFRSQFASFGTVIEASLMLDKLTGRARGFGFVTFENSSSVDDIISKQECGNPVVIGGRALEVRRAVPKGEMGGGGSWDRDEGYYYSGGPSGYRGGGRGVSDEWGYGGYGGRGGRYDDYGSRGRGKGRGMRGGGGGGYRPYPPRRDYDDVYHPYPRGGGGRGRGGVSRGGGGGGPPFRDYYERDRRDYYPSQDPYHRAPLEPFPPNSTPASGYDTSTPAGYQHAMAAYQQSASNNAAFYGAAYQNPAFAAAAAAAAAAMMGMYGNTSAGGSSPAAPSSAAAAASSYGTTATAAPYRHLYGGHK